METSEVRQLPLSNRFRIGSVLFSAALLIAGCYVLDLTWTNLAWSFGFAALLCGFWFLRYRRDPLLSEATQKRTRYHVRHQGEPTTIELVSTPKYPRPSSRERNKGLQAAGLVLLFCWMLTRIWPELPRNVFEQVWPVLGPLIFFFFLSVYVSLRAPRDAVPRAE